MGGESTVRVDVRVISATNKDLPAMVEAGSFREDLWFRLNVVPVQIPALSERRIDIAPLIRKNLAKLCAHHGVERQISAAAVDLLCRYEYAGNVRELENILERSFVLCRGTVIGPKDLPAEVRKSAEYDAPDLADGDLKRALAALEHQYLKRALATNRRQVDIAHALGVSQPTVARLLKKHGLDARSADSIQ